MAILNNSGNHPFFIVGSGRSGSTLLRMILSSHPVVSIPPETWYILPLVKEFPLNSQLTIKEVQGVVEIITSHYRWPDFQIDSNIIKERARELNKPFLRDVISLVYEHYLQKENKLIWGDKTPPYIQCVKELNILYPDAKFIHLVRDGRDVARSFQGKRWAGRWLYGNTYEWKESIQYYLNYMQEDVSKKFINIKYEDLVLNTEDTICNICNFVGLKYSESMLDWMSTVENKIPKREAKIHKKLFRKPEKSDVFRWKNEMSLREVFVIESFLSDELKKMDYEVVFKSRGWQPLFLLTRYYCYLVLPIYSFVLRGMSFVKKRIGGW